MNITDYVHGRCTVERVTIKTSLKVNGKGGGGGEKKRRGLAGLPLTLHPTAPKRTNKNYKTSSNRVIWSPLPPPQKKKDSNKLIWSEPFTAFSNWFNSKTGTGIIIVYVVQSVLSTYCQYAFCRSLNWFHILQTKIPPIIMFLST